MNIGNQHVGHGSPPFVIAELGVNHDGSAERAAELVRAAAGARADAVKLQYFRADRLLSRAATLAQYQHGSGDPDPFSMLRRLQLTLAEIHSLAEAAHSHNIKAIVTLFSIEDVVDVDATNWDAFKTASPDLINKPLIDALRPLGKPLLVSCGAATLDEVATVSTWLGDHPHILMQCVSAYPAPDAQAALAGRCAMRGVNPSALGYSDHTTALDTGALAVATGACVLEKHLTYDRAATGPDHAASLSPHQFAEYVRLAHRAHAMLGRREKCVLPIEEDVRAVSRQSLVAARDLASGMTLTREDLRVKRPGAGLPPWTLERVIGRRLARNVKGDMPIVEADLE